MAATKTYRPIALFVLTCLLILVGCKNEPAKKTPEQIFEECASGVVLIYCEYYYSLTLPTGQTMYMAGLGDDGELVHLTADVNAIKQNTNRQFGTGFFIDSKGDIMTNRHVVDISLDEFDAQEKIAASLRRERQTYLDSMDMARQAYTKLKAKKAECYSLDFLGNVYVTNQEMLQKINTAMAAVEEWYEGWRNLCNFISANSNPRAIKVRTYSKIGIAYNETYVDDFDDFLGENACVVRKISKCENADLAIIQLKNKRTPESAYVFDVSGMVVREKESKSFGEWFNQVSFGEATTEESEAEDLKIDQQLYMIGYNHGIAIAQTREGIKAQMTSGKITQLPDGERLLYSIPTMQGSSGSPVLDADGTLRGVNFAKATLNDDFNFGIPMNLIKNFLKE
ncbi:MAG: trypsin-like peptidase domain-containing protein [Bacteroidaceae bacterium]|nr:trypsin-like peptidase domain-containing protein [Bacteroidaceae bacterium]